MKSGTNYPSQAPPAGLRSGPRPKANLLPRTVADAAKSQTPAVCHGHTRPVVDLHYSSLLDETFACRYLNESATQVPPYLMFSASKDSTAVVRDGSSGGWLGTLKGHKGCIWSCRLSRDGSLGVTGSADFTAKLWDIQKQQLLLTFEHNHIVRSVEISSDSRYVATAGHDKIVRVFDLNGPIDPSGGMQPIRQLAGSSAEIKSMLFDSDRGLLFTGDGNQMRVWDLRVAAQVNSRTFDAPLRSLRYSPSGRFVVTAAASQVSFWDADTAGLYKSIDLKVPVSSVDLHPSESKFIFGNANDCEVRVASFETGEILETYKGHHGPVHVVQYTPDGEKYASGSEDGTVRIWRTDPSSGDAAAAAVGFGVAASGVQNLKSWGANLDYAKSPPFQHTQQNGGQGVDVGVFIKGHQHPVAFEHADLHQSHRVHPSAAESGLALDTNFVNASAQYYNGLSSPLYVKGQLNGNAQYSAMQRVAVGASSVASGYGPANTFSPIEQSVTPGRMPHLQGGFVPGLAAFRDDDIAPYSNSAMMSPFPMYQRSPRFFDNASSASPPQN